jgi:2-haloacid dehalogenase
MDAYRPFDEVTREAMDYALAYYGLDLDAADRRAVAAAYDALDPFPDTVPALERLAGTDLELAVLSNGAPHSLESLAEGAGIAKHFSALVSADEVETFKPAPAVYENAADRLDRSLGDCWLVSSNAWDVAGASTAGMGVAWVNRNDDPVERVGGEPNLIVESLSGLADELA